MERARIYMCTYWGHRIIRDELILVSHEPNFSQNGAYHRICSVAFFQHHGLSNQDTYMAEHCYWDACEVLFQFLCPQRILSWSSFIDGAQGVCWYTVSIKAPLLFLSSFLPTIILSLFPCQEQQLQPFLNAVKDNKWFAMVWIEKLQLHLVGLGGMG